MIETGAHAADIAQRRQETSQQFFVERARVQGMSEDDGVDRIFAREGAESGDDFVATVAGSDILWEG